MVPPTTNSPEGVSKPHGMPAPPLRFLSRIPRDSLPNLNVRPPPPPFPLLLPKGSSSGHEPDTKDGRNLSPPHPSVSFPPGRGREGRGMEHLVTTTFYGGPRRVPCLRDRGHGIGMGGEGREERGKEGERSRGTFGTEKLRSRWKTRVMIFYAWKIFHWINDSVCIDESLKQFIYR